MAVNRPSGVALAGGQHLEAVGHRHQRLEVGRRRRGCLGERTGRRLGGPPHARLPRQDREERAEAHGVAAARDAVAHRPRKREPPRHGRLDRPARRQPTVDGHDQGGGAVEAGRHRSPVEGDRSRVEMCAPRSVRPQPEHQAVGRQVGREPHGDDPLHGVLVGPHVDAERVLRRSARGSVAARAGDVRSRRRHRRRRRRRGADDDEVVVDGGHPASAWRPAPEHAGSGHEHRPAPPVLRSTAPCHAGAVLTPTCVWRASPELIVALDDRFGEPVDAYVNGSQVWLRDDGPGGITLEWRLHPVAGYQRPAGIDTYEVFSTVAGALAIDEPSPLPSTRCGTASRRSPPTATRSSPPPWPQPPPTPSTSHPTPPAWSTIRPSATGGNAEGRHVDRAATCWGNSDLTDSCFARYPW